MTTVEFCGDFMYRYMWFQITVMLCSGFNVYICVLQTTQLNRCKNENTNRICTYNDLSSFQVLLWEANRRAFRARLQFLAPSLWGGRGVVCCSAH